MVVDSRFRDSEFDQGDRLELPVALVDPVAPLDGPMALTAAQQQIYSDLLAVVKSRTPVEALAEFEALFLARVSACERALRPYSAPNFTRR